MFLVYPWIDKDIKTVEWKYPSNYKQQLRYKTYKNLWEKGYYVSSGEKFGGDFLVYPGKTKFYYYNIYCLHMISKFK